MRSRKVGRSAFCVCAVAAALSGCAGQPPAMNPSKAAAAQQVANHSVGGGESWVKHGASGQDLLYVSNVRGTVYVYTYPFGAYVATIATGAPSSAGECSDSAGNVFVTTTNQSGYPSTIYEYAHGGTSPIAALRDPGLAIACSVDPGTGNLAVANNEDHSNPYGPYFGDVAIYAGAQGNPKMHYDDSQNSRFLSCGYDDRGNLYLPAPNVYHRSPEMLLIRLSHGSSAFETINVDKPLYMSPSVQWDGRYMTISSDPNPVTEPMSVYRLRISGSDATIVGTTRLHNRREQHQGQLWIQGDTINGVDYKTYENVSLWRYPAGGKPNHNITKIGRDLYGITVSVAPSR